MALVSMLYAMCGAFNLYGFCGTEIGAHHIHLSLLNIVELIIHIALVFQHIMDVSACGPSSTMIAQ